MSAAMRVGCAAALLALTMPAARAASADELLKQVRESSAAASRVNAAREQRFLRNKNEQEQLLRQAEAELAAVQGKADRIKVQFDARQKEISELKTRLQTRAGDFSQLFAVARQGAADFQASVGSSPVTAQLPDRSAFLNRVANDPAVPGIAELEELWVTLHEELTENGKVARFEAEVVDPEGKRRKAPVVRIGTFTAFSGPFYLTAAGGQLRALQHRPVPHADELAEDFARSKDSLAPIVVDPSGGALLALHAERPDLEERIEQGGFVGYIIIVMGIAGFALAIFQFLYLWVVGGRIRSQLRRPGQPTDDNPLGRVLGALRDEKAGLQDPEVLEVKLSEAVLRETPRLERFQSLLRMFVAAGPLMGLVGTVTGMILTFQVIMEVGAGDPKLMAGGISQAMVTTVLGLGVSIPLLFINALLTAQSRTLVQVLDEQAAGLLARQLEKLRGGK